ncbi:chemotaxis protein CheC [Paenibacillus flagellatus]|uniref:CheY-P-specific phosphatase CheC n=1 Tax=Paenibacillus flagellatus TaxID=2211139 RepID=A0A2V5JUT1_9BACL|nr:chemotaxis protein CheC [Paenibacillus flagellatus]PYI50389.1 CheY-P-specific phosphatase CheC [Paenibacillus flagellatus]
MTSSNFHNFADFQLDVLKEVGNIGAGNAATALSKLLDRPVDMQVPLVNMLPFEDIIEVLGGSEQIVVAIYLRVTGEAPGNMFFILTQPSAKQLLQNLAGIVVEDEEHYSEMELSALSEIGNILAGSYLSSLADFTKLSMSPTVPSLTIDMLGAVVSYGLIQYGEMGDKALFIDTKFFEGNEAVEGHFFLVPDPESFDKIFKSLGVPLE